MSDRYNLYNLEAPFKQYLLAGNQKPVSIKNYLSDFRHFAGWIMSVIPTEMEGSSQKDSSTDARNDINFINIKLVSEYRTYLSENNIPHKTINRRLSTIRKFCSFCISQGWMKENPAKQVANLKTVFGQRQSLLEEFEADLLKNNLDSTTVNSYLSDVREFLGLG